ncbi:MAG: ArnT family glycosyltransferase [Terrimicrobiaceae bacterium]
MKKSKKKRRIQASTVKLAPKADEQASTMCDCRFGSLDWGIAAALLLFLTFQAATTWRKWPDLLVDYGRELYVPWQISKGAVLYRDIFHYYGPLGVYFNAGLFRLFGVGFSTIFLSNLVMLSGFTVGLFALLRKMTDRLAAGLAVFLFLCAFAFGNYVGIGNYNFVSPYSHDTVYGLYLCVSLIAGFWAFLSSGKSVWIIACGFGFGFAYLTKPEIMVAALAVAGLSFICYVRIALKQAMPEPEPTVSWMCRIITPWLLFLFCGLIPILAINCWFASQIPGRVGWLAIHSAWSAIFETKALRESRVILTFTGMDNPGENFIRLAMDSIRGVLAILALAVFGWASGKFRKVSPILAASSGVVLIGCTLWLLISVGNDFLQIGRILIVSSGFLLLYRSMGFISSKGNTRAQARLAAALLWSGLGAALLLKMLLNPRIEHYGFFQAMPATLDLAMFLIHDLPLVQRKVGGSEKLSRTSGAMLVTIVAIGLCLKAHVIWNYKTFPVASGRDSILTFSDKINPMGLIVEELRKNILLNHPEAKSLMVFPEGISLNYLFRLKDPSPLFEFVPPALAFYGQQRLIADLDRSPPDLVVILSRDIREFGSSCFGSDEASGRLLLEWLQPRYQVHAQVGGNPLEQNQIGAILLTKKPY